MLPATVHADEAVVDVATRRRAGLTFLADRVAPAHDLAGHGAEQEAAHVGGQSLGHQRHQVGGSREQHLDGQVGAAIGGGER